jgi:hypothetical protein
MIDFIDASNAFEIGFNPLEDVHYAFIFMEIESIFLHDASSSFLYWEFVVSPHISFHKTAKGSVKILFLGIIK